MLYHVSHDIMEKTLSAALFYHEIRHFADDISF